MYALLGVQAFGLLSFAFLFIVPTSKLGITLVVYFLAACIGGTITYHRLLSHRAFIAPLWFKYLGVLCGVWGFYGSPIAWSATHREHHRHVDTENDPHSPHHQPWWRVQWLTMLHRPKLRVVPDLMKDDFLVFVHRNYFKIQILIAAILVLLDPWALLYAYIWPATLVWNLASLVNFAGHKWGYRNYQTRDTSTNIWWLGLLVFGEGWHNNHHARPSNFSFRKNWWEFDFSEWVIRAVRKN